MNFREKFQNIMAYMAYTDSISVSLRSSGTALKLMQNGHALFLQDGCDYYIYTIDDDSVIRTCLKRTVNDDEDPFYVDLRMTVDDAASSFRFASDIREADIVAIDACSAFFDYLFPKKQEPQ